MEKADSKSKKAVKCIFDPVYFYIITSLCQFFSIIFAFITKRIKLCCENQGLWHIRKIFCQKRRKIRVDPILWAAFIQILIYPALYNTYTAASPYASVQKNGTDYLLTAVKMQDYLNLFESCPEDRVNPYFAQRHREMRLYRYYIRLDK